LCQSEIDAIRALLSSRSRPLGWTERRQRLDEIGCYWPAADDVEFEAVDVDGVPGEWSIVRGSDVSRALLYLHGGGYCSGSIVSHRRMVTEAGRAAGVRTLAIAAHIAIGGDSAGGGLTLALANRLRESKKELPGCMWLVSPWTDLTLSGATLMTNDAADPIIHRSYLVELADAYVPAGMARTDPRLSVLYADLKGLPPMLVQVGSAETLLDDSTRLAAAAGAAAVRVTLEIWPHMIHAWHLWNAHLEPGRQALASAGAFIRRHL
jgi:epsilon-lactone hydrolase